MRRLLAITSTAFLIISGVADAAAIPESVKRHVASDYPILPRRIISRGKSAQTMAAAVDSPLHLPSTSTGGARHVVTSISVVAVTVDPDAKQETILPKTATDAGFSSEPTTTVNDGAAQLVMMALPALGPDMITSPSTSPASNTSSGSLVFAHYMLLTRPPNGDYSRDIALAQEAGIDAFAVNYGGWSVDYDQQRQYLNDIYTACASKGFKAFLSIDLTSTSRTGEKISAQNVISLYNSVASMPAQLQIDGKPVLSTFQQQNPSWNWQSDILSKLSREAYFMPSTLSDNAYETFDQNIGAEGYFPWIHPHKTTNEESRVDQEMAASRDRTAKKWMAALSPWFFKRFDSSGNWGHAQDGSMFLTRALNLLALKPDFIELVSWNDWGESTYFGPADDANTCTQCYWAKQSHNGALEIATVIIKAFKAGRTSISRSSEENLWLYYRLQPANSLGTKDENGLSLPLDSDQWASELFVVGLFSQATEVMVTSGNQTRAIIMPAGLSQQSIPWSLGVQTVSASRGGATIRKTGPDIVAQLEKYNGNVVFV